MVRLAMALVGLRHEHALSEGRVDELIGLYEDLSPLDRARVVYPPRYPDGAAWGGRFMAAKTGRTSIPGAACCGEAWGAEGNKAHLLDGVLVGSTPLNPQVLSIGPSPTFSRTSCRWISGFLPIHTCHPSGLLLLHVMQCTGEESGRVGVISKSSAGRGVPTA